MEAVIYLAMSMLRDVEALRIEYELFGHGEGLLIAAGRGRWAGKSGGKSWRTVGKSGVNG
jgi:hypothetical protein